MRVLTEKEKELLTGGIVTLDRVTVSAPAFDWDFGFTFELWNDPWEFEYYDNNDGGGGGGGEDPALECETADPVAAEAYTDALAAELARAIIAKGNSHLVEYLGFIYRDAQGVLRSSEVLGGTGPTVRPNFEELGFPVSQIVALVHNHDDWHYGDTSTSERINRMPSQNDWNTVDALINEGADSSVLSLYLLDTTNAFREFNNVDRSRWASSGNAVKQSASPGSTISKTAVPSGCPI